MRCAFAILLVACGGGGGGDNGGDAPHAFCLRGTNRYRSGGGKPDVVFSAPLEDYADMGAEIDFGSAPHNHFSSTSGGGIAFAENECPQQGGWTLPPGADLMATVGQCIAAFYSEG